MKTKPHGGRSGSTLSGGFGTDPNDPSTYIDPSLSVEDQLKQSIQKVQDLANDNDSLKKKGQDQEDELEDLRKQNEDL